MKKEKGVSDEDAGEINNWKKRAKELELMVNKLTIEVVVEKKKEELLIQEEDP